MSKLAAAAPIVVQSMTNTDTADVVGTAKQIMELADAGSELVRITVNNGRSGGGSAGDKKNLLLKNGYSVPVIGDFHFNGHRLLENNPACAEALDKYRINPGNVGGGKARDPQFHDDGEIFACKYNKPVRIGVNGGSLDQSVFTRLLDENRALTNPEPLAAVTRKAIVLSALESAAKAEEIGLGKDKIILSCKNQQCAGTYQHLSRLSQPLQLYLAFGLDRSRHGFQGHRVVFSGFGRVDAARHRRHHPHLAYPRTRAHRAPKEVIVGQELLQTMGFRSFTPMVIACPGCGRTTSDYFQALGSGYSNLSPRPNASVAHPISWRRSNGSRGHGLRGQWPR